MRALLKWFGAALLLLLAVVLLRTLLLPSHQLSAGPYAQETIDPAKAARDLSGAIPFRTVSYQETGDEAQRAQTAEAFSGLHAYLEKTFPAVYENLEHQVIGANNLLFAWKGSDPSLKPVLLMGHQDVVPIEPGTEAQWTRGAFSGDIADGFIWGRGTLDDKV
ncbi:MAG TPA: M20/M25/M40 family metallo-hydrolase, partial [Candidatus Acidoferrum sp.]